MEQHHCLYHLQQNLKNPDNGVLSAAGIDHFMQAAIAIQQPKFQKLADNFKEMCTPVQLMYAEEVYLIRTEILAEGLVQDIGAIGTKCI
eukprot:12776183-Ditylum_brightwellii.AAC.1